MIEIVANQRACNRAFRHWADTLTANSLAKDYGWVIQGTGVVFTNYGHGEGGDITTQVMLGADPEYGDGVVKIVQPKASRYDKGPTTVLGCDDLGRHILLREGRLQKNNLSRLIKDDFAKLSGLAEVPLIVKGERSARHFYVVADLGAAPESIVAQTAAFANACVRARSRAGGGEPRPVDDETIVTYGMDEKWRVTKSTRPGGTFEVKALQGHVFAELKKVVGKELRKPKRNGFCVDAMIEPANLLIEIKTSTSAHAIYEGVGQLQLYPSLIGIASAPATALLLPDDPLKPIMAAALEEAGIQVFTYGIEQTTGKPRITFADKLIDRCLVRVG